MKCALIALALLWPISARATEFWQDQVNTNGYVSVVSPAAGACFLYQTAAFDVLCYTAIPSGVISVPNGVLEGVSGAITGYTATPKFVQFGAGSGGGLAQSTNLQFDGLALGIGAHVISPQPTFLTNDGIATLSTLFLYPGSGTNVAQLLKLSPKGTGVAGSSTAGIQLYNNDAFTSPGPENLTIIGRGTGGWVIASSKVGTGVLRPIQIGTDDPTAPVQLVLNPDFTTSFGAGDVNLLKTGLQSVVKTAGPLQIGTGDSNTVYFEVNGGVRMSLPSTGGINVPSFSGGGTQCVQVDNTGQFGLTGAVCGGGGGGGITQLTGDVTAGPGSGAQTATLHNIPNGTTAPGDIVWTPIAAPGTPGAGFADLYVDSTSKNIALKNDAGTVNHGVQTVACAASNWVSASTNAGGLTCTQPAFTDLSGSEACAQTPAFTGDVTKASGTCTTVVKNLPNGTTQAGIIVATGHAPPGLPPPGGFGDCWYDSTNLVWQCETSLGGISYTDFNYTCGTHSFASSSTVGTTACTQPAFADLSGAATCAQTPAFTGDTTKASGSCTTVTGALHDGAAVQHPTAGTWANSSLLQTDSFGQIATGNASCAQVSGTKTLFDGGSCAGTAWSTSGTWANGQALITSGGAVTTTNQCNVFATCAAGGGLSGTYPNPSVASVPCAALPALTGGVTKPSGSCATTLDGPSVAAATTKLTYSLQLMLGANTPNTWLLEGGPGLWSNGAVIEYPNNFKASRIQVIWYLSSNIVLTGTLSVFAAMNGAGIGGTGFAITPATGTGVHVGTNLPTGSSSSSDTYGLVFTTDNLYSAASPSAVFVTVEVMLMP